jgi:hypothetical protein
MEILGHSKTSVTMNTYSHVLPEMQRGARAWNRTENLRIKSPVRAGSFILREPCARLLSLGLFEPASIPGELSVEEARIYRRLDEELAGKSGPDFMRPFMTLQVKEGVEVPPPAGPPPPWMSKRPAGLAAMMTAFGAHPFDREWLRRCEFPVFLGYGDLTGVHEEIRAGILARLLPDLHIRRFAGMIHHFVPPEDIYSPDHVAALQGLWARTNEG